MRIINLTEYGQSFLHMHTVLEDLIHLFKIVKAINLYQGLLLLRWMRNVSKDPQLKIT